LWGLETSIDGRSGSNVPPPPILKCGETIPGHGPLDISLSLVKEIDAIREAIGVDRGALIKVWLVDKVREEKAE
jgi:hypothetical protein